MAMQEFICPNCGGKMAFDSHFQKMRCPFCDSLADMDEVEAMAGKDASAMPEDIPEDQMDWETEPGQEWADGENDGMHVYTCQSCGGEIVADQHTGATSCPFCDSPVILTKQFHGDLKPDLIIPFQLDKKVAKEALKNHLTGKRLLPKVFSDENHIDEIKGVYVPFWLFDAEVDADMDYRGTRTRTWADTKYVYTEHRIYSIWRGGHLGFNNIPVDGSSKMADDLMESIEPFDLSQAVPFQTAYLSGYLADKYDIDAKTSIGRANDRVRASAESEFRKTIHGFTSVALESSSIRLQNAKAKYALYPVWILNTTWKGKRYTFAMNGQTGKFVGNLPVDMNALWRWFFFLTGIVGACTLALQFLLWLI